MLTLKQLLASAFQKARSTPCAATEARAAHRERSRVWVESLADEFRVSFGGAPEIRVFSKGCRDNRQDFGLNELLYDVLVCRVATVESAVNGKQLLHVCDVLWQVESEFARDSGEAVKDFNKLVLGSAANKLFIGPQVHDPAALLRVLRPVAEACSGSVYVALVPHPAQWAADASMDLWRLGGDGWVWQ